MKNLVNKKIGEVMEAKNYEVQDGYTPSNTQGLDTAIMKSRSFQDCVDGQKSSRWMNVVERPKNTVKVTYYLRNKHCPQINIDYTDRAKAERARIRQGKGAYIYTHKESTETKYQEAKKGRSYNQYAYTGPHRPLNAEQLMEKGQGHLANVEKAAKRTILRKKKSC